MQLAVSTALGGSSSVDCLTTFRPDQPARCRIASFAGPFKVAHAYSMMRDSLDLKQIQGVT
jgi:hypothetical protein